MKVTKRNKYSTNKTTRIHQQFNMSILITLNGLMQHGFNFNPT